MKPEQFRVWVTNESSDPGFLLPDVRIDKLPSKARCYLMRGSVLLAVFSQGWIGWTTPEGKHPEPVPARAPR